MPDIRTLTGIGYPKRKIGYVFRLTPLTEDNLIYDYPNLA